MPLPTDGDAPGTIFRIDPSGKRFDVAYLSDQVKIYNQHIAMPSWSTRKTVAANALIRFLKRTANFHAGGNTARTLDMTLDSATKQVTLDDDIDALLASKALFKSKWKMDSKYYLIRETISVKHLKYSLSQDLVADLGGDAALSASVTGSADIKFASGNVRKIDQSFHPPYRVMYKLVRLLPPAAGISGTGKEWTPLQDDVNTAIEWSEKSVDPDAGTARKIRPDSTLPVLPTSH
jgi:hypothetical protein